MIQFSSETIEYPNDQLIQTLTITNVGNVQILFKVKTNNIKSIDARPNVGSISPGSISEIKIKRNQNIGEGVKLQIIYLECKDELSKDNFKDLWGKYQKSQQSKTFQVRALNKPQQKKVQSHGTRKELEHLNSINSNSESDPNLFQSVRVSRKGLEQLEPPKILTKQTENQQKLKQQEKLAALQKLVEQKNENKILQQKLTQKQNQIKGFSQPKELQIEKFLSAPNCKKQHLPFSVIIVIALIFFVLGFYFGSSGSATQV